MEFEGDCTTGTPFGRHDQSADWSRNDMVVTFLRCRGRRLGAPQIYTFLLLVI